MLFGKQRPTQRSRNVTENWEYERPPSFHKYGLWAVLSREVIQYIFVADCDEFHIVRSDDFVYSFYVETGGRFM